MSFATAFPAPLTPLEVSTVEVASAAGPNVGDTLRTRCGSCGATTTCVVELVTSPPPVDMLPLCDYCSSGPTPWP